MIRRYLAVAGVLAVALVAAAVPAFGKGKPGDPSITLNAPSSAAGVQPALGDYVTFTTVIPGNVQNPRVEVLCYQNGALVYGEAGSPANAFLLGGGGSLWLNAGGGAACVANLYYFTWNGGNPGTTLGQQRLNVFLAAGQIWGQTLPSHVTIDVEATFDPLTPCV